MKRACTALLFLALVAAPARGDTVFLKNGEWIDGKVSIKTDNFIEVQIGTIGKIDLPLEEVHSIEHNSRTGAEIIKEAYVEPKGKTEVVHKAERPSPSKTSPPKEPSKDDKAGKAEPKEGSTEESEAAAPDKKPAVDAELKARIEELVDRLQRQRSRDRVQAERHLEAIGPPCIPFLIPVAKSPNELSRTAVMRLFHSFGDDQVIETAIEALLDENEYVRDYANRTLKRITGEDFKYDPSASPRRRETAQEKWAEWWESEKDRVSEDRKLAEKASR